MYDDLVEALRLCAKYGKAEDALANAEQAADAIEELSNAQEQWIEQERKALLKSIPRWIPVTEQLPSSGTKVLVFEFGRVEQAYTTTYTADHSLCWVVINGGGYHRISDADCPIKWWMPLPEPPKEET